MIRKFVVLLMPSPTHPRDNMISPSNYNAQPAKCANIQYGEGGRRIGAAMGRGGRLVGAALRIARRGRGRVARPLLVGRHPPAPARCRQCQLQQHHQHGHQQQGANYFYIQEAHFNH